MVNDVALISTADAATAEWFTAALVAAGAAAPGAEVRSVTSEPIGEGKIGQNVRYRLEWADEESGAPVTVVAKFPSTDPTSRATGVTLGLYAREIGFYRELARGVSGRVAHHYVALVDETGGDFVLLLEDLSPAAPGDQLAGCTPAEAVASLDELAKIHASWWDKALPDWLPPSLAGGAETNQVLYAMLVPPFSERYRGVLDSDVLGVIETFGEVMGRWGPHACAGPSTLLHGDFRLDNLMFGGGRVAAVDWQTVAQGPPMSDVAYFLGAGLLPDVRRAHERELVEGYHRALEREGVTGWSLEECLESYRMHALGGLIMAVVAAMLVGEGERSDAMFCAMADRHARHALDAGALALVGGA